MKKIADILLTVILLVTVLTVFAVNVSALGVPALFNANETINGGSFPNGISLNSSTTVTIAGTVEIGKSITLSTRSVLVISANAQLVGDNLNFYPSDGAEIVIVGVNDGTQVTDGEPGKIDITFSSLNTAKKFTDLLEKSNCSNYKQDGEHIVVPGCAHNNTSSTTETSVETVITTTTKVYCADCETVVHTDVSTETSSSQTVPAEGSTLSEGSLTIVVGVAALVLGLVGGFILGKKKKPALVSGDNKDDE